MIGFIGHTNCWRNAKVFTAAALIPMVPGVFAFKAMIAMVEINRAGYNPDLLAMLMENFLKSMFIIATMGWLGGTWLLFYRRRPIAQLQFYFQVRTGLSIYDHQYDSGNGKQPCNW